VPPTYQKKEFMEERRKDYINIIDKIDNIKSSLTGIEVSQARLEERQVAIDKRINGSISDIEKHIEHGFKWRMAIAGAIVLVLLNIVAGVYQYGRISERVDRVCKDVGIMKIYKKGGMDG